MVVVRRIVVCNLAVLVANLCHILGKTKTIKFTFQSDRKCGTTIGRIRDPMRSQETLLLMSGLEATKIFLK